MFDTDLFSRKKIHLPEQAQGVGSGTLRTKWYPGVLQLVASLLIILTLMIGCFGSLRVWAEEPSMVTASGMAFMQAQDPAIARDEAIADALRKAVEQAIGTMISSETVVENFQLLSDKIFSQTQGYVRNYRVIKEWKEDNLYNVTVSAEVTMGDLKNDLLALKLTMQRKGMPRIMIIIEEVNVGNISSWLANTNMAAAESSVTEKFQEKGFKLVDRSQARQVANSNQIKLAVSGDSAAAANIGGLANAEVIIVGKAVSENVGTIAGSSIKSIQANVNLTAIKVDNAEVIASGSAHAAKPHISAMSGGTMALKSAAAKAAEQLISGIVSNWQTELSSAASVQLMISKINFTQLSQFKKIVSSEVRGIKSINQRNYTNNVAILDVSVQGDAQFLADKLSVASFPGFKLVVSAISQNRIDLEAITTDDEAVEEEEGNDGPLEEAEPNNDLWNTNDISTGEPLEGMLDEAGDVDCFLLSTDSQEVEYRVKVEPTGPTKLAYVIEILNGDRETVLSKTTKSGQGVTFLFKSERLFEKYFIQINSQNKESFDTEYAYRLKINQM